MKKLLNKYFENPRKTGRWVLILLSFTLIFLAYRAAHLQFDYDFENFFPQENEDLLFYQDFRKQFENDNDFILISIVNDGSILESSFLQKVKVFSDSLRTLPHIRELISPLDMKKLSIRPGSIMPIQKYYLPSSKSDFTTEDSLLLSDKSEPIAPFISMKDNSIILILKNIELISKEKSDELAGRLNQLTATHSFKEIHLLGKIMGQKTYIDILKVEFLTFMLISIVIVILFLWIAYRSIWGIAIPLLTVLLAIIGSLGIMEISGSYLNMMTTLLPVIMLVVGMSDVVHLISKYLEEVRKGNNKVNALRNMVKKVGTATLLTSLTTALGFITLIGVKMKPVQSFGIYTAIGVILAFVLSIFFITAIFLLIPVPKIALAKEAKNSWESILSRLFAFLLRYRMKVILSYVIITLLSIYGATKVQFDYYLMQDLDEKHPLMEESRYFKKFGGIRPFEMAIIPQEGYEVTDHEVMLEMEKMVNFLQNDFGINQAYSPVYPVQYLNKILRGGKAEYYKVPQSKKRYRFLMDNLQASEMKEQISELISSELNLARIYGRMVDPGSKAMLEKHDDVEAFYRENINASIIAYKLTGTPVIIDKGGRDISKTIILGLLTAFALIAISMGLLFKSTKMALLSLVPNIFPILLTAGLIGFIGIDLNMTTAIVFTIAFGIAVDDTIHFLSRYHQEIKAGRSNLIAVRRTFISTGKAIVITTIILLGGFVSLLFSSFLSTFYIGLFVSLTLLFAMITDLTLLPLLLLKGNQSKKSSSLRK